MKTKEDVLSIIMAKPNGNTIESIFKKKFPEHYEEILKISFPKDFKFSQKLYHYLNNDPELKLGLCPVCGNRCKFASFVQGYRLHCSYNCMYKDSNTQLKRESTCLNKYGFKNTFQTSVVKEKIKQTHLNRYGVENYSMTDECKNKVHKACLNKYGVYSYTQTNDFKEKSKRTCLSKYGVENYQKTDEYVQRVKNTCFERYNNSNYRNSDKSIQTKRKNHTLTSSKIEDEFAEYLTIANIEYIRQYKSKLYPFNCDFYLPYYNLYIEIQGTWMHGYHPYNSEDSMDNELLTIWNNKSIISQQYKSAIDTWIHKDPYKRSVAKQNNLNYLEIFSNDINECINCLNKILKGEK